MARPANKRRKSTAANKENKAPVDARAARKSRGPRCLPVATFAELPFDVLLEIGSRLTPLDLLHLCRVNHALRNVFTTKSSRATWKQARANAYNLPDPFPEFSEPAWANLVYIRVCNFCWKTRVMEPDFRLRCRICAKCSETHLLALKEFLDVMPVADRPDIEMIFKLIPSHQWVYQRQKVHDIYVRLTDYEDMENEIHQLPKGLTDDFCENKKRARSTVIKHASLCEDWLYDRTSDRGAELKAAGKQRLNAIQARLSSMGYENEVQYMIARPTGIDALYSEHKSIYQDFLKLPQVRPNRVLTDRVWRNIEAAILEYMARVRPMYLRHTRTVVLRSRTTKAASVFRAFKEALPPHTLFPYIPDFLAWDIVNALIHRPDDTALTDEDFTEVLSKVDVFADNWRYSIHHRLAEEVGFSFPETHPDIDTLSADLRMAATGVICSYCTHFPIDYSQSVIDDFSVERSLTLKPLFYPEVLTHKCAIRGYRFPSGAGNYFLEEDRSRLFFRPFRTQWTPGPYLKHPVVARLMQQVVTMAGLDPSSATVDDMDGCGVMFECGFCQESAQRVLFSWREISGHAMVEHLIGSADFEERVSPVCTGEIPEGWVVAETTYEATLYECLHCRDTPQEEHAGGIEDEKMMKHLSDKHQLQNPEEDTDYESVLGSPSQERPRCVKMTLKPCALLDAQIGDSEKMFRTFSLSATIDDGLLRSYITC